MSKSVLQRRLAPPRASCLGLNGRSWRGGTNCWRFFSVAPGRCGLKRTRVEKHESLDLNLTIALGTLLATQAAGQGLRAGSTNTPNLRCRAGPKSSRSSNIRLAKRAGYKPGDIIAKSDVQAAIVKLQTHGWKPADGEKILKATPGDEEFIVQRLRAPRVGTSCGTWPLIPRATIESIACCTCRAAPHCRRPDYQSRRIPTVSVHDDLPAALRWDGCSRIPRAARISTIRPTGCTPNSGCLSG